MSFLGDPDRLQSVHLLYIFLTLHLRYMRELFKFADKNNDEALCLKEVLSLFKHLNLDIDMKEAKKLFHVRFLFLCF